MKRYNTKIINFLIVTFVGLALAQYASDLAYRQRGYHAVGGEIFILPCVYLIAYELPYMAKVLLEIINNDFEDLEDKEDENGAEQEKISTNKKNGSQGDVKLHHGAKKGSTKRSA